MRVVRFVVALLAMPFVFCAFSAQAAELIRNGTFADGMGSWNVPEALYGWNPVSSGQASLHPPSYAYTGTIIYQNLNVTGVAGKTISFSCLLSKLSSPPGKTVVFSLDYLDTANNRKTVQLANPDNASITTSTPVSGSVPLPADAHRIVSLTAGKTYSGDFSVTAISLQGDGVTVGAVPVITALSAASGPYGSAVTVTGSGFGASAGTVTVGGISAGVTVSSWSDAAVTVNLASPARSGLLKVINSFVESDGSLPYNITSPNLTAQFVSPAKSIVQGEVAEFPVRVDFLNGFTLPAGMNFTVTGSGGGASPFTGTSTPLLSPLPIRNSGGFSLRINTASLAPGSYQAELRSTAAPFITLPFTLTVVKVASIKFFEYVYDPVTYESTKQYITEKRVSAQGEFYGPSVEAQDATGTILTTDIVMSSSDPGLMGVYKIYFYDYSRFALDNGTVSLVATTPDGTTASLPVIIAVPDAPKVTNFQLSQSTITNLIPAGGKIISYGAQMVPPTGSYTYGPGAMGYLSFDMWDYTYTTDTQSFSGTVKILNATYNTISQPPDPTYVGMHAHIGDSSSGASQTVPLRVINDNSFGAIFGGVRSLGGGGMQMLSLDFCDESGANCSNRMSSGEQMSSNALSVMGGIAPGRYKVKYTSWNGSLWYPNAATADQAEVVTIVAAGEDSAKYNLLLYHLIPTATLNVTVTGPGSVASQPGGMSCSNGTCTGTYPEGNWVTLHATPDPGVLFTGWSGACTGTGDCTIPASSALSVSAAFALPQRLLTTTITSVGGGSGTVNSDPAGIACPGTCSAPFLGNSSVTLMPAAGTTSLFSGWSGCDSVDSVTSFCTVAMTGDRSATATFTMMKDVRVVAAGGTVRGYYDTVTAALPVVASGDTIQMKGSGSVVDQVFFNKPNAVVRLIGGFNSDYTPGTLFSSITGKLTVRQGSVTASRIVIR